MIKLKAKLDEENYINLNLKYKNTSPFEFYCLILGLIAKYIEDNSMTYKEVLKRIEADFKEAEKAKEVEK